MNTTVVFAEVLIIGVQSFVWFALVLSSYIPLSKINFDIITDWETVTVLFVLMIAYTLGILIDRLADLLFNPFDLVLRKRYLKEHYRDVHKMRMKTIPHNRALENTINYARSRIRIVRATTLNLILTIIAVGLLCLRKPSFISDFSTGRLFGITAIICFLLILLTIFTWAKIMRTYYRQLLIAYELLE